MKQQDMIDFWIETSDKDYTAMIHLFEKKDFSWSLFMGHLVIEKLLKGYYIKVKNEHPPFIHDLLRLAEKAELKITDEQMDILDTISTFNIRARYDDYKMEFYKKCTSEFTETWMKNIGEFRKWIKNQLMS